MQAPVIDQLNADDLDVHPASEAERLEIFRNVHDVWGAGLPLEEHVARRSHSVHHQRAEWFAGVLGGRVVASLGCHPLEFLVYGEPVAGFSICAVHTVAEYRGRGLAPRLLAAVEGVQRERGGRLAVLFSDIGLAYYERLGYVAGRSHLGLATVDPAPEFTGRLVDEPGARYDEVRAACESRRAFVIRRTDEYAAHLLRKLSEQRRWLCEGDDGELVGGFALTVREGRAKLEEWFARDDDREGAVLRAVLVAAASLEATGVAGWVPDTPAAHATFDVWPREVELTMLKSLDGTLRIDGEVLAATDWLNEIDHV